MQKKQIALFVACLSVSHEALAAKGDATIYCPKTNQFTIEPSKVSGGGWEGGFNALSPAAITKIEALPFRGILECQYYIGEKAIGILAINVSNNYNTCKVTEKKDGFNCS